MDANRREYQGEMSELGRFVRRLGRGLGVPPMFWRRFAPSTGGTPVLQKTTTRRCTPFLMLGLLALSAGVAAPRLEDSFAHPPEDAKPWVYWFWSDGNLTRAGITADLEAMQRVGIGGVLIMEVDQNVPKGPVRFMSPAWREMFSFAMSEAARLGLKVNMNNDAGWTGSGGPWIDAEHSMQKVVWKEQRVSGPQRFAGALVQPETVVGHYRDIALLAFPTPATEVKTMGDFGVTLTASSLSGENAANAADRFDGKKLIDGDRTTGALLPRSANRAEPAFVQLEFAEPFEARSLEVVLAPVAGGSATPRVLCQLQASQDGRAYRDIAQLQPGAALRTFEAVRARYFRVVFTGSETAMKELRVNEVTLASVFRLENFAAKSGLKLVASPADVPATDAGVSIERARVIDLTSRLRDGRLEWQVPAGDWTLVRFGHTSTGKNNYPSPAEGKGLEVDKLSRAALDRHFDGFIGKLIAGREPKAAGALTTVHIDSWEVGYQNWTPGFREAFTRLRGYDPLPWLPAFTGRVVDDAALSERFLWDVRRTIGELLNENYAARMAERAHESGRRLSIQGYRYGPFDCLSYTGRADLPIGEFWVTSDPGNLHPSVKTMTSAGHIYGKPVIAAEAFTASDMMSRQRNHPYTLKAIGDAAFCAGVNQFIFHRYSMQPWVDDRKPGMTMGPWGVEYERTATWWEQTKAWHEYLARCQHLLRQGSFVADLCYLQSEEGFNNPALAAEIKPAVPKGYDFDFCSDELVRTRMTVENGRLTLPGGMSYRVLVLPQQRLMTPELLRKIRDLVRSGAVVYGPPPLHSPSLKGYPRCDDEVRKLVAELWVDCDCDEEAQLERTFGKGKVIWGTSLATVLARSRLEPDFAYRNSEFAGGATPPVRHIHRSLPDRDIYFVANLGDAPASVVGSFRVASGRPELWQAESGVIEATPVYESNAGRMRVPLELAARGSVFVVFRKDGRPANDRILTVKKDGVTRWETKAVSVTDTFAPVKPIPDVVSTFTMVAWVKPGADTALPAEDFSGTGAYSVVRNDVVFAPPAHEVLGKLDAAGAGFAVGRNGVTVHEHGDHHFPATLVYRAPIADWVHVAVVFDRGTPTLFLNGERVTTGLRTLVNVRGGVGVPHGREVVPFKGEHSELQQFGRALEATEIRELMRTTPKIAVVAARKAARGHKESAVAAALNFEGVGHAWTTEAGRYEITRANGRADTVEVAAVPAALVIEGAWRLRFPPNWGAPAEVELPTLGSWSEHAIDGVRYFSGTATYGKTIAVPADFLGASGERRAWLDLGDVQVIAEVTLNGRALGTLWRPPFRIDVTDALKPGRNELEIAVTNLWVNRLIGDEQRPSDREWTKVPRRGGQALKAYPDWLDGGGRSPTGRFTLATWKHYEKNAPLLPSGLLGPVTIRAAVKVALEGED